MNPTTARFRQHSSFLKRQTWIVALVMIAFVLQFLGVFLSSSKLLTGLTDLNTFNRLFTLTNRASEGVVSAAQTLDKVTLHTSSVDDLRRVFDANLSEVNRAVGDMEILLPLKVGAGPEIVAAKISLKQYQDAANAAFFLASGKKTGSAGIKTQVLLASQYQLEASEALRKAQIAFRNENTRSFESTYRQRHFPLITAVLLGLTASLAILIVSLYSNRRIRRSIKNLLHATDEIADGNLRYRAPVMEHDEIGKLTFAVNEMVERLELGQDRTIRLQSLTAAFSEALSRDAVANVVMRQGLPALGADAGAVVTLSSDGKTLSLLSSEGYSPEMLKGWDTFSADHESPVGDAIRENKPIWVESRSELVRRYPKVNLHAENRGQSFAAIPLTVSGRVMGGITLSFTEQRIFSREDQAFCISLARQCAQALNRAELYDLSQQAVLVRDEFLSIASHELRTPLTPLKIQIQGLTRLLAQQKLVLPEQERFDRMIGTANSQVIRMTRLIDELLDVTRIGTGNLKLDYSRNDLSKLVRDVVDRFGGELTNIDSAIDLQLEPDLIGSFDPFRIEQVLTNLLTNAMRYGPGKPIHISTRRLPSGEAELEMRDEGLGIAPIDQKRIFERFERASSPLNYGGLGLGLYIVEQIVQRHQGKIRVESELGKGASFIVLLPLEPPANVTPIGAKA